MPISANIQEVIDTITQQLEASEDGTTSAAAADLHKRAVEAIHSGRQVQAEGEEPPPWVRYMSLFAKNEDELARLIPTDGTENDPVKRDARAYLVANGTCAPGTVMRLLDFVTNKLDA